MSAGHVRSGYAGSTASWLEPESNQTSRMFVSRSKLPPPHAAHVNPSGTKSSIGRSYHASAPWVSNTCAARSVSAFVRIGVWHEVHVNAGIGTPHVRWREMHQSGRSAIML